MTSPKSCSQLYTVAASGAAAGEGFLPLMRKFLKAQEQREDRHVLKLWGLHDSILQMLQLAATPSDVGCLRMNLLTPAAQRVEQGGDIKNYLLCFERLAKTWNWPVVGWRFRFVPLLTGLALEAYLAMDE